MSLALNANDELMEKKMDVNVLVVGVFLFLVCRRGALIGRYFVNMERSSRSQ